MEDPSLAEAGQGEMGWTLPDPASTEGDPFYGANEADAFPVVSTSEPVVPTPTDVFDLPQPEGQLDFPQPEIQLEDKAEAYNRDWEIRLREKAAQEAVAKQSLKEEAERFLDGFHDEKTDSKLAKMETNRKIQDEVAADKEQALEMARSDDQSRWRRVNDLVDIKDLSGGSNDRMAKILLNLKVKGLTRA